MIFDGEKYREPTKEEQERFYESVKKQEEYDRLHPQPPTPEERITELESRLESFESAYKKGVDEA